jgi:hypothetical protein
MNSYYFLSRMEGAGTKDNPMRPMAARLGSCGMLDFRPDQTKTEGWCFACVTREQPASIESSPELIYLGQDSKAPLPQTSIDAIKKYLKIDFHSKSLEQILAEILLFRLIPGRGIGPQLDGTYVIHLGALKWEATESEVFEFVGRLREPALLSLGTSAPSREAVTTDLRNPLSDALQLIADVVNSGQPEWLEKEAEKVNRQQSAHPLVIRYIEARSYLQDPNSTRIARSPAANWILMLAYDMRATSEHVSTERLAPRLRNPKDCEPTRYELYVMASYIDAGIRIQTTDANKTGEFKAFADTTGVYIECKHKNIDALSPRRVQEVFDKANTQLQQITDQAGIRVFIKISCRTDPTESDLPGLVEFVSSALKNEFRGTSLSLKFSSKFEIDFIPGQNLTDGASILLPKGLDYSFAQGTLDKDPAGAHIVTGGYGVGWTVTRPGGWIRSVVESIRQAASQLPADSANIIYIHVPTGGLGAMTTRLDTVMPEIENLLSSQDSYKRINAVVLSGEALLPTSSSEDIVTLRFIYRIARNTTPRTALPENFRIFGSDFTRGRKTSR